MRQDQGCGQGLDIVSKALMVHSCKLDELTPMGAAEIIEVRRQDWGCRVWARVGVRVCVWLTVSVKGWPG